VSDEAEKYDRLLADVVALVDTLDDRLGFDDAHDKRQDGLFAVFTVLAEVKNLNLEQIGGDFSWGHASGQLFLARRILTKIKKELG
jgi:hypothetical protein